MFGSSFIFTIMNVDICHICINWHMGGTSQLNVRKEKDSVRLDKLEQKGLGRRPYQSVVVSVPLASWSCFFLVL